jgi:hypothetical protein
MHYNHNGINKYDDLIGNIYAEITILPGLKFRTDFGLSSTSTTINVLPIFYVNPVYIQYQDPITSNGWEKHSSTISTM